MPYVAVAQAAIAQLAARRSHNPKVVSSILTHRMKHINNVKIGVICYANLRELVQLPHNRSCVSVGAVVNCGERRGGCRLRKRSNATNKGI